MIEFKKESSVIDALFPSNSYLAHMVPQLRSVVVATRKPEFKGLPAFPIESPGDTTQSDKILAYEFSLIKHYFGNDLCEAMLQSQLGTSEDVKPIKALVDKTELVSCGETVYDIDDDMIRILIHHKKEVLSNGPTRRLVERYLRVRAFLATKSDFLRLFSAFELHLMEKTLADTLGHPEPLAFIDNRMGILGKIRSRSRYARNW